MRQICSRKNYKMYINDAFNLARNKKAWDNLNIYTYDSNSEIFYTILYRDFSFELYISSQIYIYTNIFHHSHYYKYFYKTEHNIGEGGKI